jgi:hypothetical protein
MSDRDQTGDTPSGVQPSAERNPPIVPPATAVGDPPRRLFAQLNYGDVCFDCHGAGSAVTRPHPTHPGQAICNACHARRVLSV